MFLYVFVFCSFLTCRFFKKSVSDVFCDEFKSAFERRLWCFQGAFVGLLAHGLYLTQEKMFCMLFVSLTKSVTVF